MVGKHKDFSLKEVNKFKLTEFRTLFSELRSPQISEMNGRFRSEFVGPGWLRTIAPPGLAPLGLGGWWGKTFDGQGGGMNIVQRQGELREIMPIVLKEEVSLINGRSGLNITYPPGTRFPWPWVVDEIRWLDDNTILGMTLVTKAGMHRLALPFLLHKNDN
ncbi:MAG: hypothetical protein IAF02_12770 [Anaerolineae bacterium]|nr:hypothetical protein [Anaerolineae bacterium]